MFMIAREKLDKLLALPQNEFWGSLAKWFLLLSILGLIFFRLTPSLDIWIARQFFDPWLCFDSETASRITGCLPFAGEHDAFLKIYQKFGLTGLRIGGFVLLGVAIFFGVKYRKDVLEDFFARITLGATLSLLLGPVILTNLILKAYAGRPRPRHTDIFGGDLPFMPANVWSDLCASNCSFVSGEASGIFWGFALLPLIAKRFGRDVGWWIFIVWTIIAASIAFNRVAFGAHYFSDVVLGALFTLTIVCFCHWALSSQGRARLVPAVENAIARIQDFMILVAAKLKRD